MEDHSIDKVTISGPALASMIQRFSTSPGSVDGLIFGHVSHIPLPSPTTLPILPPPPLSSPPSPPSMCSEGLEVGSLSRLMESEATNYTAGVEDLYEKMLVKIETLTRLVEQSSAKVLEQENHNRKLRYKAARSVALE